LQAAGKASFDPKASSGGVALEVAAKYLLDKDTFVKVLSQFSSKNTLTFIRARSTILVLQQYHTSKPSVQASKSESVHQSILNVSKKQPTKLVSHSKPVVEETKRLIHLGGCIDREGELIGIWIILQNGSMVCGLYGDQRR
jgi:hypothetical protein